MHKVVIVEDDRIIRKAIVQADWNKIGFEVAGEAADGQEAWEIIQAEHPQLIVTDINMPFMNGIELAKRIRKEQLHTRIIFLTGYDDFEYLHEAILLKSDDYLLKPVHMNDLLDKAKAALEAWKLDYQKTEQLEKTIPLLQEKFISDLLFSSDSMEEMNIEAALKEMAIHLKGPSYLVMNVFAPNYTREEPIINQLIPFSKKNYTELVSYQGDEAFLFHSVEEGRQEQLPAFREKIRNEVGQSLEEPVFVTMSSVFEELADIKTAIVEAKINMEIQKIAELAEKDPEFDALFGVEKGTARVFAELNPAQSSHDKIKSFFDFLTEGTLRLIEAKKIAFNFVVFLIVQLNHIIEDETEHLDIYQLSQDILAVENLEQLIILLEPMVAKWETAFERQQVANKSDSLVDKAVQYMKEHFSDPDLSLVKLSEEIHVTSPYLSNLFKEQTSMNFTEYLLELRMEKSKELLRTSSLKTYEIAEAVGYTNPHYFSSSFKKYAGQTPMAFRKGHGRKAQ